ncbi:Uncharacterised protein at_DN0959 [Pycnogonum litorale]
MVRFQKQWNRKKINFGNTSPLSPGKVRSGTDRRNCHRLIGSKHWIETKAILRLWKRSDFPLVSSSLVSDTLPLLPKCGLRFPPEMCHCCRLLDNVEKEMY